MRKEKDLISVIIPVYNAERFLETTVLSVLNQTYSNLEVLLIDDCSKDGSLKIAKHFAEKDSRVTVIPLEKNAGVAHARNVGIRQAKGSYIALLDSDDVWTKEKLTRQIALLREKDAQIAYCSYDFIDEQGSSVNRPFLVPAATNYQDMLAKSVISCSTAVIDAGLLKTHAFRPEFLHEDYVLWMELLSDPQVSAVGIFDILAHYRIVNGSRSHDKIKSAAGRWKVYRDALGMGIMKSTGVFLRYALNGIVKYYG